MSSDRSPDSSDGFVRRRDLASDRRWFREPLGRDPCPPSPGIEIVAVASLREALVAALEGAAEPVASGPARC